MNGTVTRLHERPLTIIDAAEPSEQGGLAEIWRYRDLLRLFTAREIQLRYQQTTAGIVWVLLQPLLIMLVLSGFATLVRGVRTESVAYPLFTISGLVPWMYFTHAFTTTTFSLISQSEIMGKIYFPRLIVPMSAAAGGAVDFLAASLLLPLFMLYYGVPPTLAALAIPLFAIMALAAALAMGLWLSVIHVRYRDAGNALPFIMQLMFFTTPIVYPAHLIPEPWRTLAGCNPMFGVIEGFRWAVLGARSGGLHWSTGVSALVILILLVGGALFFRWQEPAFIDEI
jgi:lipopolysaccharide transport system permease protein